MTRLQSVLLVPVVAFSLITAWAVATSPVAEYEPPFEYSGEDTSVLRTVAEAAVGRWQNEPLCIDDGQGDMDARSYVLPTDEGRSTTGPGDLVSACAQLGEVLVVEASVAEPVPRLSDGKDDAELTVSVGSDAAAPFSVTVQRVDDSLIGQSGWTFDESPPAGCVTASSWKQNVFRVELDPACLETRMRLQVAVGLVHADPYQHIQYSDDVEPVVLLLEGNLDPPEAAIATVLGSDYLGDCEGLSSLAVARDVVCSVPLTETSRGHIYGIGFPESEITLYMLLSEQRTNGTWSVLDRDIDGDELPSELACPTEDAACLPVDPQVEAHPGGDTQQAAPQPGLPPASEPDSCRGSSVPAEAVRYDVEDLDGDGARDEVALDEGMLYLSTSRDPAVRALEVDRPPLLGMGAVDVAGDARPELFLRTAGRAGERVTIVQIDGCSMRYIRNVEGDPYAFDVGTWNGALVGLGCVDLDEDGRLDIMGLAGRLSSVGYLVDRTEVRIDGDQARNGHTDQVSVSGNDAPNIALIDSATCGTDRLDSVRFP